MYKIYTTAAFILKSRNRGENSRIVSLYTRELGMVEALAQGVRKLKSKLRPHLEELSLARVSLVKGREFWRVTSAEKIFSLGRPRPKARVVSRLFLLLNKFVHGQSPDQVLFEELQAGLTFLENSELDGRSLSHFEIIMVLKVLYQLGYLSKEGELEPFLTSKEWSRVFLELIAPLRHRAIASINTSFGESQL